jgi:hypothetical protein
VSEAQIEHAALELCRHYGSFLMIPLASSEFRPTADRPPYEAATQDSTFWQEREDEFRKHDTGHNTVLAASWSSLSDTWRFQASGSTHSASAESMQLFKSLAREAAKGLGSKRGADSWIDWLDLLRSAKDEGTRKLLYAQVTSSSYIVSEVGRDHMIRDGEALPAGALLEFGREADGVARRLYWDASTAKIENLFRNSANLCLELRSLSTRGAWEPGYGPEIPRLEKTDPRIGKDQPEPTLSDIEAALNEGNRKLAVKLRCTMDGCAVTDLYLDAFKSLAQKPATKRTAFNRWQASRHDTPSWADKLIRARLLN